MDVDLSLFLPRVEWCSKGNGILVREGFAIVELLGRSPFLSGLLVEQVPSRGGEFKDDSPWFDDRTRRCARLAAFGSWSGIFEQCLSLRFSLCW